MSARQARLNGTETQKCLMKAFAGESQARNRYTFFAKKADKDGHHQVAAIFRETAEQEMQHAKIFFRLMAYPEGDEVEITAGFPIASIGTTEQNLKNSSAGEHDEWATVYPGFADIAEKEGFPEIAATFRGIATIEKYHDMRFGRLYSNFQQGEVYKKVGVNKWQCMVCGNIVESEEAPKVCGVCAHPQGWFQILNENF